MTCKVGKTLHSKRRKTVGSLSLHWFLSSPCGPFRSSGTQVPTLIPLPPKESSHAGATRAAAGQLCRLPALSKGCQREAGRGEPRSLPPSRPALAPRDEGSPLRYPGTGGHRSAAGDIGSRGWSWRCHPWSPGSAFATCRSRSPARSPGPVDTAGAGAHLPGMLELLQGSAGSVFQQDGALARKGIGKFSGKINSLRLNKEGTGGHPLSPWVGNTQVSLTRTGEQNGSGGLKTQTEDIRQGTRMANLCQPQEESPERLRAEPLSRPEPRGAGLPATCVVRMQRLPQSTAGKVTRADVLPAGSGRPRRIGGDPAPPARRAPRLPARQLPAPPKPPCPAPGLR